MCIRDRYSSDSRIYKILCPRLSRNEESAPFLLSAGADRVVRYWFLGDIETPKEPKTNTQEMTKQSFIVMSPDDRKVKYSVENFDGRVLYERDMRYEENGNGRASWQTQSGASCLKEGIGKVPCAGHADAILDMELVDLGSKRFLVTCGRDNLVKLWI
eukprot:TRINITY_DN11041_c0_g2_i1.p1 TRINITY_DN11041_c0_g2~~TRINITY_DN11041_c0_g2_i1.p1  ORF type:complete len:158 (+),score=29.34 TRINITY_DN11041_c0_g2_i1:71-544(+)